MTDLSIIIPVYDEAQSLPSLYDALTSVMSTMSDQSYEIVFVNDGSRDESLEVLKGLSQQDDRVVIVDFIRNYGQTAAMMAGIDHARGDVIVTLDADMQNDPQDIPLLLEELNKGYDVVSGWRKDRKDAKVRRNFPSRVANAIISKVSGVPLHDYGCSLKAYRKEVIKSVRLYGEMHRFIPIYTKWMGGKVSEVVVRHHPRIHGKSKYGLERTIKVLLDLMVVQFLMRYFSKPIYVFGAFAIICFAIGFLTFGWMLWLKYLEDVSFILTPLPLLVVMSMMSGIISLLMGLLAEMLARTYFESQGRRSYVVRDVISKNLSETS